MLIIPSIPLATLTRSTSYIPNWLVSLRIITI